MKNRKRMLAVCGAVMLGATLLLAPGLPWSGRSRYAIKRWSAKFATTLADLRGQHPRTVSLTGKLTGTGAFVEAVRGARVNALESGSGYDAMSDGDGRFVLPHLTWYPGATFTLFISVNQYQARSMKVRAPLTCPNDGVIDLGALSFDQAVETDAGEKSDRYLRYDIPNRTYYVDMFDRLTATCRTNHEKLVEITGYVSTKRNPEQRALSFRSARQVLERGAPHCSHLAFAMAAITAAGGYPTRTVHITDTPEYSHTHVAVEVFYESAWHLYDPTYGVSFSNGNGAVASHKELRLTPALITLEAFPEPSEFAREALEWMPSAYGSGICATAGNSQWRSRPSRRQVTIGAGSLTWSIRRRSHPPIWLQKSSMETGGICMIRFWKGLPASGRDASQATPTSDWMPISHLASLCESICQRFHDGPNWMADLYRSGLHHYYYIKR